MNDLILTGASRGIGRALTLALAESKAYRLILIARDQAKIDSLAAQVRHVDCQVRTFVADLSRASAARKLGAELVEVVNAGATLVHNAGVWPSERQLSPEGYELAFATNCLGPLALQEPLLQAKRLDRVLVVGAGLMTLGRFDAARTPRGDDFSALRTYCNTKLALAAAMHDVAAAHPEVDIAVVHPGVVQTDLGARQGVLGKVLSLVKRRWEDPAVCAARLTRILQAPRWSEPGEALWMVEETPTPWPEVACSPATRGAVRTVTARALT